MRYKDDYVKLFKQHAQAYTHLSSWRTKVPTFNEWRDSALSVVKTEEKFPKLTEEAFLFWCKVVISVNLVSMLSISLLETFNSLAVDQRFFSWVIGMSTLAMMVTGLGNGFVMIFSLLNCQVMCSLPWRRNVYISLVIIMLSFDYTFISATCEASAAMVVLTTGFGSAAALILASYIPKNKKHRKQKQRTELIFQPKRIQET